MKKRIFAVALAAVMAITSAATVFAERVTADKTYDGGLVVDGSTVWNSAGSGETFVITEDGVTVTFDNQPFVRNADNWSNFVFETLATDAAKGVTMRADAFSWTYGDSAVEPTVVSEISWTDWADFADIAPGTVTLTATKTAADTVVFAITFKNGATEKYTVTYPAGVPEGLEFQVGADGGIITLKSVVFGGAGEESSTPSEEESTTPSEDPTVVPGDEPTVPATNPEEDPTTAGEEATTATPADATPTDSNPVTGDVAPIAMVVLMFVAAAGIVVVLKSKKVEE